MSELYDRKPLFSAAEIHEREAECSRLTIRLAEAEKDAERYRWLKQLANTNVGCCPVCGYDGLDFKTGEVIDAELDNLITSYKKNKP